MTARLGVAPYQRTFGDCAGPLEENRWGDFSGADIEPNENCFSTRYLSSQGELNSLCNPLLDRVLPAGDDGGAPEQQHETNRPVEAPQHALII